MCNFCSNNDYKKFERKIFLVSNNGKILKNNAILSKTRKKTILIQTFYLFFCYNQVISFFLPHE